MYAIRSYYDEKCTRFYGVLGKVCSDQIEEKYRFVLKGREVLLNRSDIFDVKEKTAVFPTNWKDSISKYTQPAVTAGPTRYPGTYNFPTTGRETFDDLNDYWPNDSLVNPNTGELSSYDGYNDSYDSSNMKYYEGSDQIVDMIKYTNNDNWTDRDYRKVISNIFSYYYEEAPDVFHEYMEVYCEEPDGE